MRVYALYAVVTFFTFYAWRNWFRACCVLVLLLAIFEHPDSPKNIAGIQGLNPWNVLFISVMLAALFRRRAERRTWDLSSGVSFMLWAYAGVVFVSTLRLWFDRSSMPLNFTSGKIISDYFINTFKWVALGLLLFDACRTPARVRMMLICTLGVFFLLAVQVIRWMPLSSLTMSGDDLQLRSLKILLNEIGYHRVNLSMMLSGASWACLAMVPLLESRKAKTFAFFSFLMIAFGQALTGGRMGYVTWGVLGMVFGFLRHRKYMLLMPLAITLIVLVLPSVRDRMIQGLGMGEKQVADVYDVTSGRTLIWPLVIDEIVTAPIIGHGRQAMRRTGLSHRLSVFFDENFGHPHNAYLELLFDNGVIGFLLVMPFYAYIVWTALVLYRRSTDPLERAVAGVAAALTLAFLVAGLGSQTFYPREGAVGMWIAIFLFLRVKTGLREDVEERSVEAGAPDRRELVGQSS